MLIETEQLPDGWEVRKLGSVALFQKGKKTISSDFKKDGYIPYIGADSFEQGYKKYCFPKNTVICNKDDILMLWDGERSGLVCDNLAGAVGSTIVRIRVKNIIYHKYLYYYLNQKFKWIQLRRTGMAVPHVPKDLKDTLPVPIPPLTEQKQIATVLASVDKLIEKTNELIAQTKKVKQGLLQELLTKGIGHTKFKTSPLGEIPESWECTALDQISTIERGKFTPRPRNNPNYYNGNIPFIQTGDVVKSNVIIKNYTQTLNEKGLKVSKLFERNTIVLTIAANIGEVGILNFNAAFPDSLIGVTANVDINTLWLFYYLKNQKQYFENVSTQSAQKNINLQTVRPLPILLPPLSEQQQIVDILASVDNTIQKHQDKLSSLQILKKGLMQDLLTGKVRATNIKLKEDHE